MIGLDSEGSHAALTASQIFTTKSRFESEKVSGENSYCQLVWEEGLSFVKERALLVHATAKAMPSSSEWFRTIC